LLETFVLQELRRQASWYQEPVDFFQYRDRDDFEVDMCSSAGGASVAGVDVKAAATVTDADFRGLRKLRDTAGKQCCGRRSARRRHGGDTLRRQPLCDALADPLGGLVSGDA